MRETKFRAWVPKMKKMFYSIGFCSRGVEVYWYDPKLEDEIILGDRQENSLLQYVISMQYIGLKDKNKKEIYEEDVFQFGTKKEWKNGEGERGIVKWHEELARFGLTFYSIYGGEGYTGKNQHLVDFIKGLKIIGNTCENPELVG